MFSSHNDTLIHLFKLHFQGKGRFIICFPMEKKWQKNMTWKQMSSLVSSRCPILRAVCNCRHFQLQWHESMCQLCKKKQTHLNFAVRKWRNKSALGGQGQWQMEVGEALASPGTSLDSQGIKENCSNVGPFCIFSKTLTFELRLNYYILCWHNFLLW